MIHKGIVFAGEVECCAAVRSSRVSVMMYLYAFDHLGFKRAHLDMRKGNESVRRFHEFCGAWKVGETEKNYLYKIDLEKFTAMRKKTAMYLAETMTVER